MRVLLVEDNKYLIDELSRVFSVIDGAQLVKVSTSANEAIQWLSEHPEGWDLALIDIFLGQGNGYSVVKQCRKTTDRQRIVMMSNYTRAEAEEQALKLGVDRFFDKATELDALVAYCKSLAAL